MSLEMPREQGPAASLASYQLDVLRGKNRALERRLAELIEIAGDNEQLVVQVHSLTLGLLRADSLLDSLRSVVAGLTEDFDTDLVRVVLLGDARRPARGRLAARRNRRRRGPARLRRILRAQGADGRPPGHRQAVLPVRQGGRIGAVGGADAGRRDCGMLAVGSHDANRFHPGMGTMFLKLIAESVNAAIQRYADRD